MITTPNISTGYGELSAPLPPIEQPYISVGARLVQIQTAYEGNSSPLADRLNGRGLWASIQASRAFRAQDLAQRWDNLRPLQRGIARTCTLTTGVVLATAGVIIGRTTGATAHGLEDTMMLSHQVMDASVPMAIEQLPVVEHDITIPAEPYAHPEPVALGEKGTIWHQVEEYADDLGYDHLTSTQARGVVGKTLDGMNMSWAEARMLPENFKPELPTRQDMETALNQLGAVRVHEPETPVIILPEQPDPVPPVLEPTAAPPSLPPPAETIPPVSQQDAAKWWVRMGRHEIDDELVAAALLVGVAALAIYAGNQRQRRIDAEDALRNSRLMGRPVVAHDDDPDDAHANQDSVDTRDDPDDQEPPADSRTIAPAVVVPAAVRHVPASRRTPFWNIPEKLRARRARKRRETAATQ